MSTILPNPIDLNSVAVPVDDDHVAVSGVSFYDELINKGMGGGDDVRVSDNLVESFVQTPGEHKLDTEVKGDSSLVGKEKKSGIDDLQMEVGEQQTGVVVVEGNDVEMKNKVVLDLNFLDMGENVTSDVKGLGGDVEKEGVGLVSSVGVGSLPDAEIRSAFVGNLDDSEEITAMEVDKQVTSGEGADIVLNRVDEDSVVEFVNGVTECSRSVIPEDHNVATGVLDINPGANGNQKSEDRFGVVKEAIVPPSEPHGEGVEVNHSMAHEDQVLGMNRGGNQKYEDAAVMEAIFPRPESHGEGVEVKHDGDTEYVCDMDIKGETSEPAPGLEKQVVKQASPNHGVASFKWNGASYSLTTGEEGEFSKYDLVWGKVKSHPWWPGLIFDPSDASEKAMKYYKPDRFLVAYFGDNSFAWNLASSLKPFKMHFSQMEKQTDMVAFCDATNCALGEVARRVELGLSCSCLPEEAKTEIKSQIITNAGIREEACGTDGLEISLSAALFGPDKFVEYIKELALYPSGGADRLELVIVRSQVAAFSRFRGYAQLPEFHVYVGIEANDVQATPVSELSGKAPYQKRKRKSQVQKQQHGSEDDMNPRNQVKNLPALMGGDSTLPSGLNSGLDRKGTIKPALLSAGKKRKTVESFSSESRTKTRNKKILLSGNCDTESSKLSKIGERISRIAGKLTGSPPVFKYKYERFQKGEVEIEACNMERQEVDVGFSPNTPERSIKQLISNPKEYSSPDEMLSLLCLVAQNPMKHDNYFSVVIGFFSDFRKSVSLGPYSSANGKKSVKKTGKGKTSAKNKNTSNSKMSRSETYDYDLVSDSYWTDMIIQTSPQEKPSGKRQKRNTDLQFEPSLEGYDNFEEKTFMDLDLIVDSTKDTSIIQPEDCSELNPMMDTEKQNPDEDSNLVMGTPIGNSTKVVELYPTILELSFTDADSIPPVTELNRIFSRFGALKESETEILRKNKRARVVFQRRDDAEVAFSSAGKFSTFGPALRSYQLKYYSTPRTTRRASLLGNTS